MKTSEYSQKKSRIRENLKQIYNSHIRQGHVSSMIIIAALMIACPCFVQTQKVIINIDGNWRWEHQYFCFSTPGIFCHIREFFTGASSKVGFSGATAKDRVVLFYFLHQNIIIKSYSNGNILKCGTTPHSASFRIKK